MTIAACYLTPEGVVLGADSTTSVFGNDGSFHYYNNNQKLFEIGEESTLGLLTWGLGALPQISYRTLVAQLADELKEKPAKNVAEVMNRWIEHFWDAYSAGQLKTAIDECVLLSKKKPYDANQIPADPNARTEIEENLFHTLKMNLVVGFCIGGYIENDRSNPGAFQVTFDPIAGKPKATPVGQYSFWGAPNIIKRLIFGYDTDLKSAILASGHWTGSSADLDTVLAQQQFGHAMLPIRDAIDFVHACIYSTIKAMKFSNFHQICGGPIELAVITTDRKFRWVWHKCWDAAITEGDHR